ncbi:glycosyl hydrolase family 5 [Kiloniella spongiae]|uniref:Glycosyl hydrolase family 5 n=1 Tax=Kiloniella spongiae TaxID=1489064 RepID=A0A0H2MB95_9PROT|nr:DUF2155 domain-containing protein [Kiloniella spongiae]KLN59603.1 glycosyl hydrolase family 5 [Kiloniella spongiae]
MALISGVLAGGFIGTVSQPAKAEMISYEVAVLQGLNKITARVSELRVPVNQPVRFGSLEINARECRKSRPEEMPESASFLEIDDHKENTETTRMFAGWMFASSPAVSAMEHPVYDIWVVNCMSLDEAQAASEQAEEETKATE